MTSISIPKPPHHLSSLLYHPESATTPLTPLLILIAPSGSVKEQSTTTYARLLSRHPHNFTTLTYDPSHHGSSGGLPRFLEDPAIRVSDVSAIIDYIIANVKSVDPDKIGVVGICTGGGYAVAAAVRDFRIKAVCTISLVNIGDFSRLGWEGRTSAASHIPTLKSIAEERTKAFKNLGLVNSRASTPTSVRSMHSMHSTTTSASILEAREARRCSTPTSPNFSFQDYNSSNGSSNCYKDVEMRYIPFIPTSITPSHPQDLQDLAEYYLTPRAYHPRAENKMLITSLPLLLSFDAFAFVETYLLAPVMCIVGAEAGSRWHTDRLDIMLRRRDGGNGIKGVERVVVVEGAGHVDFFDDLDAVDRGVQEVGGWMRGKLVNNL